MNKKIPNPELVQDFYTRGLRAQVLRIAIRLDIFSALAGGPADALAVAHVCQCNLPGMERLLDCLTSFHLLEKQGKQYNLSPTSKIFLVRSVKSYVGDWILTQTDPEIFDQVLQSVQSGEPFRPTLRWEQLAWLESYNPIRITESITMWESIGVDPAQIPGMRVLDLACGSSIMSFVLAKKDSRVRVTCKDSPEVLEVAKDLATRMSILDQVSFSPGDLLQLEQGVEQYDVVLLGNVTNFFTKKQNLYLFRQINQLLTEGGSLIINVTMDAGEINPHVRLYSFVLWAMTGTSFYDSHNYQNWLLETGFYHVKQLNTLWICAKKNSKKLNNGLQDSKANAD